MLDAQTLARRYIASWNGIDSDARRQLIERLWTEDARYIDPMMQARGQVAIAELIGGVHAKFPGLRFVLNGMADGHGLYARFSWHFGPNDGPVIARGTDFTAVAEDGRLIQVTGFLDQAPGAA